MAGSIRAAKLGLRPKPGSGGSGKAVSRPASRPIESKKSK